MSEKLPTVGLPNAEPQAMKDNGIQDKVVSESKPSRELALNATLQALQPEFIPLLTQYCQHTGRITHVVTANELANLIDIHGGATASKILKYAQRSIAPEWTWLNSEGLNNLCLHQPFEYLIYSLGELMPIDDKGDPYEDTLDRAKGLENLYEFADRELVKQVSEVCRRLLAKCQPSAIAPVLFKCKLINIGNITESNKTLLALKAELEACLDAVKTNRKLIADAGKSGFSAFRTQAMIIGLNPMEAELMREFGAFEIIPQKSADTVEMLTESSSRHKAVKAKSAKGKKLKFANQSFKGKTGQRVKLTFGDKK